MMTKYPEKPWIRVGWVMAALLAASGLLADAALAARQAQKSGVFIPDAGRVDSYGTTDLSATPEGAIWKISLPHQQAWQILKRSLQRLSVTFTETSGDNSQLLTGWVTWGYDAGANVGHSNRPRFGSAGTVELHRFRFTSVDGEPDKPAVILIQDANYQKMVDIAPDSESTWMEWRESEPQAGAAFTFGQRLQGEYEVAISLQPVSVPLVPPAVEPEAPETTIVVPSAPLPPLKVTTGVVAPVPVQTTAPTVMTPKVPRAATVARTTNSLLVDLPVDATWGALLRALQDLGIDIETADSSQLMIVTRWIDAAYDEKNQQLDFRSNNESRWAFNWGGRGPQHHRFQLVLIGTGQGDKTLVRAYHTGFQEQVDQTPDSSQTLMAWEDRKTDSNIAAALLRRLRIIVDR